MGHLKGCLRDFVEAFFQLDRLPMRFRPSYFPFTSPSMEVDIGCSFAGGELAIGEGGDWLEILGSGMVHPHVLEAGGIDPGRYQGFAFGLGIDRLAMLKYGIPDLRAFFEADLRWLRHYGFRALDLPQPSWRPRAMKFTLTGSAAIWIPPPMRTASRAALNALGLEVEGVEDRGSELAAFAVGRVLSAEPHPPRGQAAGMPGRYRPRRGSGRVRRAQCAGRHEGGLRPGRRAHSR